MGGSATNSGINYQQRIGALALVAQYSDFDLGQLFGISQMLQVRTIHFETSEPIDDLKIACANGSLYLQIKRSLSFQTEEGTEFYKSIDQFVKQYVLGVSSQEYYILVTSPQSSSSITETISKITESIRLNEESFESNPLNISEKDIFDKFKKLFFNLKNKHSGKSASEQDFIDFSKRVYVSTIDMHERGNQ